MTPEFQQAIMQGEILPDLTETEVEPMQCLYRVYKIRMIKHPASTTVQFLGKGNLPLMSMFVPNLADGDTADIECGKLSFYYPVSVTSASTTSEDL